MRIYDASVETIDGKETTLEDYEGKTLLIVNVASQCGLTPQYAGLQQLHDTFADRGLAVLGFPCNQFGGQEPGTHDEIKTFCETKFGVTFQMFAKLDVNGENRHPLYNMLTKSPDPDGKAGDIMWNFEKFVVSPEGMVIARFRPMTAPDAPEVVEIIEKQLKTATV